MVVISKLKLENNEKYENASNENHERTSKRLVINISEESFNWIGFFFRDLQITNVRIAVETKNQNSFRSNMIEFRKT